MYIGFSERLEQLVDDYNIAEILKIETQKYPEWLSKLAGLEELLSNFSIDFLLIKYPDFPLKQVSTDLLKTLSENSFNLYSSLKTRALS